jgi:hypothetical protein
VSLLRRRRTYIYLALALMTSSWLTVLVHGLVGDVGPSRAVTLVVLALLTLLPLEFSRWLRGLELRGDVTRGLLAGGFTFLALLVLSSGFYNDYGVLGGGWLNRLAADEFSGRTLLNQVTSLTLVTACWGLGVWLGDMRLTTANLFRYFYLCIAALALPSIFFISDVSQEAPWLYYLFLLAALLALGLGRIESTARRSQRQEGTFTLYWLAQIGLGGIGLLALVAAAQTLGLARGFGLVLVVVAPLLALLIYPIAAVGAQVIAQILRPLFDQLSQIPATSESGASGSQPGAAVDPTSLGNVCTGIVTLALFLIVLLAIGYGARRWRQLIQDQEVEEREAWPSLRSQVSRLVGEGLERLDLDLPGLGGLRRRLAARSIRRIYAALTELAAERGYPRPAARTPYEYLPALRQAFPGRGPQVGRITEAYVAVHYGEVPETREALAGIRADWEEVREAARRSPPVGSGLARDGGSL